MSAGSAHTCGVTTDNRAYCWGWASFGQLGDGTTTTRLTPVTVAGALRFRQLSAGGAHTCARTPAAMAHCWGSHTEGRLGTGIPTDPSDPTNFLTPTPVAGRG